MTPLEGIALWAAIAGYALGFAAWAVGLSFGKPGFSRAARRLSAAAFGAHGGAIVIRWITSGHAPVMGAYENALLGAWFLPFLFGVVAWRYRPAARALPAVLAATLLILGNGVVAPAELGPLEPPYRSSWLAVHVLFAWFAFGSYIVASGLSAWFLWSGRRGGAEGPAPLADELTAKLVAFGFLSHAVMIASGAIWAHGLWGRYWGWDPIETWSLVTWLIYAVYLHLRFTLGWKGRRAAWLTLVAAAGIAVTFFGIGVVSNVHTQLL